MNLGGLIDHELCRISDHNITGNNSELCWTATAILPATTTTAPVRRHSLGREAPKRATTTAEQQEGLWTMQNQGARYLDDDSRHPCTSYYSHMFVNHHCMTARRAWES